MDLSPEALKTLKKIRRDDLVEKFRAFNAEYMTAKQTLPFIRANINADIMEHIIERYKPSPLSVKVQEWVTDDLMEFALYTANVTPSVQDSKRFRIVPPTITNAIVQTHLKIQDHLNETLYPTLVYTLPDETGKAKVNRSDSENIRDKLTEWGALTNLSMLQERTFQRTWKKMENVFWSIKHPAGIEVFYKDVTTPEIKVSNTPLMGGGDKCRVLFVPVNHLNKHWFSVCYVYDDEMKCTFGFISDSSRYVTTKQALLHCYRTEDALRFSGFIDPSSPTISYTFLKIGPQEDHFSCGHHFLKRAIAVISDLAQTKNTGSFTITDFLNVFARHTNAYSSEVCEDDTERTVNLVDFILKNFPHKTPPKT